MVLITLPIMAKRTQWTEKQAWEWQEKVGVIKGFNGAYHAYPGQTTFEILKKASELGFNSVRFWVSGGNVDEKIAHIQRMIDDAAAFNMTVSPVLTFGDVAYANAIKRNEKVKDSDYEQDFRKLMRHFANEERIVLWDLMNEPRFNDEPRTYDEMDIIENMVKWSWDEDVSQPITSSIIWATINPQNKALKRISEVEQMMDVHNFHSYDCALNFSKNICDMLDYIKSLGDRPIVCTECLTRVNGSGLARSLAVFAKYKVNFYSWGLFVNDRNWEVRWRKSTYDPYEPMFHNLLYSDGDIYDARDIELIRNYHFVSDGEEFDEGIEISDRWTHERVWRWMVCGPVKGTNIISDVKDTASKGYNSVRVRFYYADWKNHRDEFFKKLDQCLQNASSQGLTVMPVLLDDGDVPNGSVALGKYVNDVINRYYSDNRVLAWELYCKPGEKVKDTNLLMELVGTVFRYARNVYPNQPMTMTPVVNVKPFKEGFDPWQALVHGHTGGWGELDYSGGSNSNLVYKIWSLSDVISFATDMPTPEAGWLISMCYRFGRPIFCTDWRFDNDETANSTLKRFAMSHVFWFASKPVSTNQINSFRFIPISTERQD